MSHHSALFRAAEVVSSHTPSAISQLKIVRETTDRPPLWYLPDALELPPYNEDRISHAKKRPPSHIPKPRNPYILFRSHLIRINILPKALPFCRSNNNVSRIISHIWKALPKDEKMRFYLLADEERRMHLQRYPEYAANQIRKETNVQEYLAVNLPSSNSILNENQMKCMRIAEAILNNVQGLDLIAQIREITGEKQEDEDTSTRLTKVNSGKSMHKTGRAYIRNASAISKARSRASDEYAPHPSTRSRARTRLSIRDLLCDAEDNGNSRLTDFEPCPSSFTISPGDRMEALDASVPGSSSFPVAKQTSVEPLHYFTHRSNGGNFIHELQKGEETFEHMVIEQGSPYAAFGVH
ncbi:hypothetical protein M408DRAFT_29918 [Serendipita vermifera MAFF 305830]|uniref:HMG box domain-containing protein n=1 Tax=Serendipita vermifera MAFF 305830 TaxID=933852 RepID=A0A0C3ALR2_SERVB|nr:hypothetical protein M408DRAFT_29918 [Serendipita vermifera MAFF 305830]